MKSWHWYISSTSYVLWSRTRDSGEINSVFWFVLILFNLKNRPHIHFMQNSKAIKGHTVPLPSLSLHHMLCKRDQEVLSSMSVHEKPSLVLISTKYYSTVKIKIIYFLKFSSLSMYHYFNSCILSSSAMFIFK